MALTVMITAFVLFLLSLLLMSGGWGTAGKRRDPAEHQRLDAEDLQREAEDDEEPDDDEDPA